MLVCVYSDAAASARLWAPAVLISRHVRHLNLASLRVRASVTVAFLPSLALRPLYVPQTQRRRRKSIPPTTPDPRPPPIKAPPFICSSFRPSWSSSTPAYGTLLPWGRTTRRPLPVSPFLFFSDFIFPVLFLRRFRHSAKASRSLARSLYLWAILFCRKDHIYPPAEALALSTR